MPRASNVPPKAPAAVGRGKPGTKGAPMLAPPPTRTFSEPHRPEEKEVCPLCVEDLDATDLEFQPCPCGYRVCLFCYSKLKELCNSACPNCRRGYGSEEAKEFAKQLEEERAQEALKPKPAASSSSSSAASGAAAAAAAATRALPKPTAAQALRRDAHAAPAHKRHNDALAEDAPTPQPSLPSGATWAAASPMNLSRDQSVEIERPALPMDEASWPSLASTAQPTPVYQHQQHQQHRRQKSNSDTNGDSAMTNTRRSSSVESSMDRVASSSSLDLMTSDPPVTPEQLAQLQHQHQQYQAQHAGAATATLVASSSFPSVPPGFEGHLRPYFGAQVSTTVNGVRRSVNVPLSLGSNCVEPYPEAPALLTSMHSNVSTGTMSSKEAASHLMALLQQKEDGQAAKARALMAVGKVPPGFGPATAAPSGVSATSSVPPAGPSSGSPRSVSSVATPTAAPAMARAPPPGFTHLASSMNPVVPAPTANSHSLIQPPAASSSGLGMQQLGGMGGNTRTYSMWSGLPGIDLGSSSNLGSLWGSGSALQQAPLGAYNPLGANLGEQGTLVMQGQQGAGIKAPPPGFGPSPYQPQQQQVSPHHPTSALVSPSDAVLTGAFRQPYQPLGSTRYTPLGSQPPTSYRPPLGAGL